jgi:hypothetical protein
MKALIRFSLLLKTILPIVVAGLLDWPATLPAQAVDEKVGASLPLSRQVDIRGESPGQSPFHPTPSAPGNDGSTVC